MPEANDGLGGALSEAVAHLRHEPLLSFGIAAVIVIGFVATAGTGNWVPVAAAVVIALAVLVAWVVQRRGTAEPPPAGPLDQRAHAVRTGRDAELQSYEGPAPSGKGRVTQRLTRSRLGAGTKAQSIKITGEPEEPPKEP